MSETQNPSKELKRIKRRRTFSRSTNKLVEIILKLVRQLEDRLDDLDREQDARNELRRRQIETIEQQAAERRAELARQLQEAAEQAELQRQAVEDSATILEREAEEQRRELKEAREQIAKTLGRAK